MRIAAFDAVLFSLALGAMLTGLSCEPASYEEPADSGTKVDVDISPEGVDVDVDPADQPADEKASPGIDVDVSPQGVDVDVQPNSNDAATPTPTGAS